MADYDHTSVRVGPVTVGRTTERKPKTKADRRNAWICWAITVVLIAQVAPFLGVILVLASAIYAAAHTAPTENTHREQP
jgi:hypothetical protein